MEPPKNIPLDLYNEYTMNNSIHVFDWYINGLNEGSATIKWTDELIEKFINNYTFSNIKSVNFTPFEGYTGAALQHVEACEKYGDNIRNKDVAVIGSQGPWIEAILVNAGAKSVTTVEYIVPECNHNIIKTISYDDFCKSTDKYDSVFSFSSIEHSGLGRYGDPLNPNGDIETFEQIHKSLKDDGLIFIGFPVGRDAIVWNAHRVYGPKRLEIIFKDFNEIEWIGMNRDYIYMCSPDNNGPHPLIVLSKK